MLCLNFLNTRRLITQELVKLCKVSLKMLQLTLFVLERKVPCSKLLSR